MKSNSIGERIIERLKALDISMSELARRTGISKSALSNTINNDERDVMASSLFVIAEQLQTDPVWLYTGYTSDVWQQLRFFNINVIQKTPPRKPFPKLKRSRFYPRACN